MKATLTDLALPLFVPADRPERFGKADAARPDALIIDLEDAVAPQAKERAREALKDKLLAAQVQAPIILRVNAAGTDWHAADLALARTLPLSAVMVPKAQSQDEMEQIAEATSHPVVALIETAQGLAAVNSIATRAARLAFGSFDFAADMGMEHTRQSLLTARFHIALASRAAGLLAPLDGVTTAINDNAVLEDDCRHARELGFGGKMLIHPAQLEPARQAFAPSRSQVEWADRVLSASAAQGVVQIDGMMIDAPVLARARQIKTQVQIYSPKENQ